MKDASIKKFLETMCEYHTVNITQTFSTEDGQSLTVRCIPHDQTFEITHSETQEVERCDSVEQATKYILGFIAAHDLTTNS